MFTIPNNSVKCINFIYIYIMVTVNTIAPTGTNNSTNSFNNTPGITKMRSVFEKRPSPMPGIETQGPLEKPEKKPGKFDAFNAYIDEQLGSAGFRKSGADNKAGFVAQSGRFKGMTQDEARAQLRKEFAGFDARRKQRYAGLAEGRDVQAPGIVERPNLLAQEQAGAERLLNETGDILERQSRERELANLDMGVRTGTVGGKKPEPKKMMDVPRKELTAQQLKRMSEAGSMSYAPGSSV